MAKEWKKHLSDVQHTPSTTRPMIGGFGESPMAMTMPAAGGEGGGAPDGGGGEEPMKGKKNEKKKVVKTSSFDKQSEEVKAKRRAMHELLEIVRFGFSNSKFGPMPADMKAGLATLIPQGEDRQLMTDVLNAIKDLQDTLNSPSIADRDGLVDESIPKVDALLAAAEVLLSVLTPPVDGIPTPNEAAQPAVTPDQAN